jgi:DNA-binding transcriptional ArsR family regulator
MKTDEVVDALAALAQSSRLELFRVLVRRGPAGVPAGQIATRLGIPATTLSFHLGQLTRAGLLRSRRDGRSIVYAADYERMQALLKYLGENCCQETGCEPVPEPARAERKKDGHGDETRAGRRRR